MVLTVYLQTGNLVWYKAAPDGGHFYALETPKRFVEDMEDFTNKVWK